MGNVIRTSAQLAPPTYSPVANFIMLTLAFFSLPSILGKL